MATKVTNRRKKIHELEIGWNDRPVTKESSLKGVSFDNIETIRTILQTSTSQKILDIESSRNDSPVKTFQPVEAKTAFDSIAQTFGFIHHEGSDRVQELKVLKTILIREGLVNKLVDSCNILKTGKDVSFFQSGRSSTILDILSQLRHQTCTIVEQIQAWRQTIPNLESDLPRPFLWRGTNYLLKLISDLDFLATVHPLVSALGVLPSKMKVNPLMLPNSLAELDARSRPTKLAAKDANGLTEGSLYEERLRLRKAERILLQECEFNMHGIPAINWEEEYHSYIQQQHSLSFVNPSNSLSIDPEELEQRKRNMISWTVEASLQLLKLQKKIGERLTSASTHRLDIPTHGADDENTTPVVAKYGHCPPDLVDPVKLTEFMSDTIAVKVNPGIPLQPPGTSSSPSLGSQAQTQAHSPPMRSSTHRKRLGLPTSSSSRASGSRAPNGPDSIRTSTSRSPPKKRAEDSTNSSTIPANNESVEEAAVSTSDSAIQSGGGDEVVANNHVKDAMLLERMNSFAASPRFDDSRSGIEEITAEDVELMLEILQPPEGLRLAMATVLVILTDELENVNQLSWDAFVKFAGNHDVPLLMNTLSPPEIPLGKIEAVQPSAKLLQTATLFQPDQSQPLSFEKESSAMKFICWVVQVVNNSLVYRSKAELVASSDPQQTHPHHLSSALSTIFDEDDVSTRHEGRVSFEDELHGGAGGTDGGGQPVTKKKQKPKPLEKLQHKKLLSPGKHKQKKEKVSLEVLAMESRMTEMVDTVFKRPLVFVLLASRASPPDRFVLSAYDPFTSKEAKAVINTREYQLFRYDMEMKYDWDNRIYSAFDPNSVDWWKENYKQVITIKENLIKGTFKLSISKKAIADIVDEFMTGKEPPSQPHRSLVSTEKVVSPDPETKSDDGLKTTVPSVTSKPAVNKTTRPSSATLGAKNSSTSNNVNSNSNNITSKSGAVSSKTPISTVSKSQETISKSTAQKTSSTKAASTASAKVTPAASKPTPVPSAAPKVASKNSTNTKTVDKPLPSVVSKQTAASTAARRNSGTSGTDAVIASTPIAFANLSAPARRGSASQENLAEKDKTEPVELKSVEHAAKVALKKDTASPTAPPVPLTSVNTELPARQSTVEPVKVVVTTTPNNADGSGQQGKGNVGGELKDKEDDNLFFEKSVEDLDTMGAYVSEEEKPSINERRSSVPATESVTVVGSTGREDSAKTKGGSREEGAVTEEAEYNEDDFEAPVIDDLAGSAPPAPGGQEDEDVYNDDYESEPSPAPSTTERRPSVQASSSSQRERRDSDGAGQGLVVATSTASSHGDDPTGQRKPSVGIAQERPQGKQSEVSVVDEKAADDYTLEDFENEEKLLEKAEGGTEPSLSLDSTFSKEMSVFEEAHHGDNKAVGSHHQLPEEADAGSVKKLNENYDDEEDNQGKRRKDSLTSSGGSEMSASILHFHDDHPAAHHAEAHKEPKIQEVESSDKYEDDGFEDASESSATKSIKKPSPKDATASVLSPDAKASANTNSNNNDNNNNKSENLKRNSIVEKYEDEFDEYDDPFEDS